MVARVSREPSPARAPEGRVCYLPSVRVCVFDLDHTIVRSPLDLAAMAADLRALIERACGPLPPRTERYRVGELIAYCQTRAPAMEAPVWALALDHERRALEAAALEPGALAAIAGAHAAGFATALWTNNAREVAAIVLDRFGLGRHLDLVVTRDEMRQLKPDPDGWRVIAEHFGLRADGGTGGEAPTFLVGDSWVDGLAAAAAGIRFIAYRPNEAELARWKVTPFAKLEDLAHLPAWLAAHASDGQA